MPQFELFQDVILHQMLNNDDYLRKSMPFVKNEYFEDTIRGKVFTSIFDYTEQYGSPPNEAALKICLQSASLSDKQYQEAITNIPNLYQNLAKPFDEDWLVNTTETWCKKRAFYLTIVEGSTLLSSKVEDFFQTDVPQKMEDALAISFDASVGLDYREDWERRYDHLHDVRKRFPFDIDYLNKITKGGLPRKTLSVLMSTTTGGFKSGSMCHFTAAWAAQGYNVLYLTMEMGEEEVAKRIDANLMDTELDALEGLPFKVYETMAKDINKKITGNIVVKEYPTSTAHAGHFRYLLKELKNKKGFIPDIICVDYLNICASSRMGNNISNSFQYVKAIAEELRALAVEFDVAMISATQGNRDAADASDISIANVSESIGLPSTVDLLLGIILTEEMDTQNYLQYKQLKNRMGDCNKYRKINIGLNKAKMRLFDIANQPTQGATPSGDSIIPTTVFGDDNRSGDAFSDFKFK